MGGRRSWQYLTVIEAFQGGVVAYYLKVILEKTALGLPLDDGWIHLSFARNLARWGILGYNEGQWSTGTTSLLWVGLLALFHKVGFDLLRVALALGVLAQGVIAGLMFIVLKDFFHGQRMPLSLSLTLLFCGCGPILWHSLSGMETCMFIALGLGTILTQTRGKGVLAGILLGLALWTRPEGLALVPAMAVLEAVKGRLTLRRLVIPFVIAFFFFVPQMVFNFMVAGSPLPATFLGRRWLYLLPESLFPLPYGAMGRFILAWADGFPLRVMGLNSWVTVLPCLALMAFGLSFASWQAIYEVRGKPSSPKAAFLGLILWALFHNLAYFFLMPVPGQGGRYQAMNYPLGVMGLGLGLFYMVRGILRLPDKIWPLPWGCIALLTGAFLTLYGLEARKWPGVTATSIKHINEVHRAMGQWVDAHLPKEAQVATFDIGAIKYFSGRTVIDLGGLVDSQFHRYLYDNRVVEYLRERDATHLALPEGYDRGFGNLAFRYNIYENLGEKLILKPLVSFEGDEEEFWGHWQVLANALPRMVLYSISWQVTPEEMQAEAEALRQYKASFHQRNLEEIYLIEGLKAVGNGDLRGARSKIERALQLSPDYGEARQALDSLFLLQRQSQGGQRRR